MNPPPKGLYDSWPRGWYSGTDDLRVRCSHDCRVAFSPGPGLCVFCPECALKRDDLTPDEELEYLDWLEDQAEIADAGAEPEAIYVTVRNSTPWQVILNGVAIAPQSSYVFLDLGGLPMAVECRTDQGFAALVQLGDSHYDIRAYDMRGRPLGPLPDAYAPGYNAKVTF